MGDRQVQVRRLRRVDEELPVERNGLLMFPEADDRGREKRLIISVAGLELQEFFQLRPRVQYLCRSSSTRA